jgi:dienelactone hydrolase
MKRMVLALVLGLAMSASAHARTVQEQVTLTSLDPTFKGQLRATYVHPAGAGPFPAMVLLHTCAGIQPFVDGWAAWFVAQGYAALVLDSFGPRGVRNVCAGGTPTARTRAFDALGALVYLRSRPDVDAKRIGVIGWSHGGAASFIADSKQIVDVAAPAGGAFRAAIGVYAACNIIRGEVTAIDAPLLLLEGSADDWAPAASCQPKVDLLANNGFPASMHVYPGATHAFDNPADKGLVRVGMNTHMLVYDAGADRDAHERVKAFLADAMK